MKSKELKAREYAETTLGKRGFHYSSQDVSNCEVDYIRGYSDAENSCPKDAIEDIIKYCEDMAIWDKIPNSAYYRLKRWVKDSQEVE